MKRINLEDLNENQNFAACNFYGPMLIIAGAGAGKTRVITYKIAKMLNSGIRQKNILALTFTTRAASEMKERVEQIFSKKLRDLHITNFHSFGCEILRKNIHLIGYKNNFSIYDTIDQTYVLKSTLFEMEKNHTNYPIADLLKLFSDIKTSRIELKNISQEYQLIYNEYQDYLKVCNGVDFDDLIYLCIQIFLKYPDVLSQYQNKYKFILVDEFQDTSSDQYKLVSLIAKAEQNFCVVGDDDQSIYGFRGADYQNIINFEKDYPSRTLVKLEQNYRSSKEILHIANELIKNNTNRKEKTLWSDKNNSKAMLYVHQKEDEEIFFLSQDILIRKSENKNLKFMDFAILTRTNTIMAKIEDVLIQEGIPYYISGGYSFFEKAEIKDIVCYLRYILNPLDEASLIRVINKPRRTIGKASLQKITHLSKKEKKSVYKILLEIKDGLVLQDLKTSAKNGIIQFLKILDDYKSKFLSNKNLSYNLNNLIKDIEYSQYLVNEYGVKDNIAKFKMKNVSKFVQMLENYEKNPDNFENVDIYRYINNIVLSSYIKGDNSKEKDKVGLLTIHSAKGLEWDTVYIVCLQDGVIPHQKSLEENDEEEERRLFYVALTRAKNNLILNYAKTKTIHKKEEQIFPSPFLDELPKDFIQEKEDESKMLASKSDFESLKKNLSNFESI